MLTVREVLPVLNGSKEIKITIGYRSMIFLAREDIPEEIYGDYLVKDLCATGEEACELVIAVQALKRGDA